MLGFKPPDIIRLSARRLQCGIPSVKKKWTQLYTQQLRNNNLFNKQFQLEKEIHQNGGVMTEELAQRFENIMSIRLSCMTFAEKNCRKLKMGRLPFSPETATAQTNLELIQAVITKKKGRKYSSRKLRRLEKKVGRSKTMNMSLTKAEEELKKARSHFWECIKNAKYLRQTFLEKRAQELAQEKDTKQEAELKQLLAREKQRESARKIKHALNKLGQENITTLNVTRQGQTTELTTKYQINQVVSIRKSTQIYSNSRYHHYHRTFKNIIRTIRGNRIL